MRNLMNGTALKGCSLYVLVARKVWHGEVQKPLNYSEYWGIKGSYSRDVLLSLRNIPWHMLKLYFPHYLRIIVDSFSLT
jgi:hypothetical protein